MSGYDGYMSKDECFTRKRDFINKELCDARMKNIIDDVQDTRQNIRDIHKKLDNHMAHMVSDLSEIKTIITLSSKNNKANVVSFDKEVLMKILGIMTIMIIILFVVITGKLEPIVGMLTGGV